MSGGESSGKNYYGFGKEEGGRKGDHIIWDGPFGPDSFPEPVFEFPPQHKSEFTNETPLRQYDNHREPHTNIASIKCGNVKSGIGGIKLSTRVFIPWFG